MMLWQYYCEKCGQLRAISVDVRPVRCGNCASKRIDVEQGASQRLMERRFGAGVTAESMTAPAGTLKLAFTPMEDGTRYVENISGQTLWVARANGQREELPLGASALLGPLDQVVSNKVAPFES